MSTVFKALSDPTRRGILELLRKRPMSAGDLASHFDVSKPTMSAHFAVLREAALITSEKHGKSVVYELQLSVLEDALLAFAKAFGWQWQNGTNGTNGTNGRTKTSNKAANKTKSPDDEVVDR